MSLRLEGTEIGKLHSEPEELLRKVPFFEKIPDEEFGHLADQMRAHSFAKGEEIIIQGEKGRLPFSYCAWCGSCIAQKMMEKQEIWQR